MLHFKSDLSLNPFLYPTSGTLAYADRWFSKKRKKQEPELLSETLPDTRLKVIRHYLVPFTSMIFFKKLFRGKIFLTMYD